MQEYTARADQFSQESNTHAGKALAFSLLRGAAFIAFVACLIVFFNTDHNAWLLGGLVALVVFSLLIGRHKRHETQKLYFQTLADINKEETRRAKLELTDFESGEEFLQNDHPNQHDLDIFGEHSLYQLVNRCSTTDGKKLLAQWLSQRPSDGDLAQRQEMVKELSADLDWLQRFQANTRISVRKKKKNEPTLSASNLLNWSSQKSSLGNQWVWYSLVFLLIAGILTSLAFISIGAIPYQYVYANLVINAIVLGMVARKLSVEVNGVDKAQYLITSYLEVIRVINSKKYTCEPLQRLKERLSAPHDAEDAIGQLQRLSHRISARANMLYLILDLLCLLDFFLWIGLLRWKQKNGSHIGEWLETIHELEVLMSIASFAHSHGDYRLPTLAAETFKLHAKTIAHPLIPAANRVSNDYLLEKKGSVDIITGSNMSGKSTFQRTLGINLILARLGAPVCASYLEFSNVEIFTSMRTRDNLSESTSSFYAELKRITQLLQTVEDLPTFFLLDEILKGTNSEDRHLGAVALANKLSEKEAFGMISTHDLSLGELEKTNPHVRNFSFNSQIEGSNIRFDYRLTPGPCKSFNASQLMRNMGIID